MKTLIALGALTALTFGIASGPAAAAPASAPQAHKAVTGDFSAAKRHYRHHRHWRHQHYGYRRGPFGAYAADPSIGYFPSLRRAQSLGRCVEDLGYGRFDYCD